MIISQLPENSRVWFFGASTLIEEPEKIQLISKLDLFVSDWKAHGSDLVAGYEILHDSILLVAVDESVTPPTGCSIDKVFKLLESMETDWFQRLLIWQPFCNTSKILSLSEAKEVYIKRELDGETIVANTMVSTLKEAREQLYIPFKNSWAFAKINL